MRRSRAVQGRPGRRLLPAQAASDPLQKQSGRRARIAQSYCVIAMAGDNLGDFADVFNADESAIAARRAMVARGTYAQLWGNGWFLMPNPVYGAWQEGALDEVFPPDARWQPAASDIAQ